MINALPTIADEAFALVDSFEVRARKAVSEEASNSPIMALPSRVGSIWGEDRKLRNAANQLEHFRGWPFAAVRAIAQRIAGQPVRVARPKRLRNASSAPRHENFPAWAKALVRPPVETLEIIDDHPLLEAIARPNPLMVQWVLLYVTVAGLELTGKAYWWIRGQGSQREIWPVPSSWITPRHDEDRAFARWEITPQKFAGRKITVPGDEVAYFYYPDPAEPFDGASPLAAQARAVFADEAIERAQEVAFRKGTRPGMAFIIGDEDAEATDPPRRARLEQEQRRQIISSLRSFYQGVDNWNEPLILDALIRDVKQITTSPAEMDFLRSGQSTKARIMQGFGVNPIILGEIEGVNRASSAEARRHFCDFTINPKIELLSQMISRCVAPKFRRGREQVAAWIEPCRADDPEMDRREVEMLLKFRAMTINEARARRGLPPMEGGDVPPRL